MNYLVLRQQPLIPKPEEDLCHGDHIPFAILHDPFQVVLFVIHIPDHTPVNVFLGRGHSQYVGK